MITHAPDARTGLPQQFAAARVRLVTQEVLLAVFFIILATIQIRLILAATGPRIFGDEGLYIENARALASGDFASVTFHYTPLYSAMLSFASGLANPYVGYLAISNLAALFQIPLAYVIASRLGSARPVVPALLVGLLPFQASHAQFVMAENLSGTLFLALCASVLIRRRRLRRTALIVIGMALVATKYLFFPVLLLLPLLELAASLKCREIRLSITLRWVAFGVVALGGAVAALQSVGQLQRLVRYVERLLAFGGADVFWISVAFGTLILALAVPTTVMLATEKMEDSGAEDWQRLRLLIVFSAAVGVFVAFTHHGWAGYNAEISIDNRFNGRYLSHLVPALLIYVSVRGAEATLGSMQRLVRAGIAAFLIMLSYLLLFRGGVRNYPRWGSAMQAINPDISVFDHAALPSIILLALAVFVTPVGRLGRGREVVAIAVSAFAFAIAADAAVRDVRSFEARELARYIQATGSTMVPVSYLTTVTQENLDWHLRFIGYPRGAQAITYERALEVCAGGEVRLPVPTASVMAVHVSQSEARLADRILLRPTPVSFSIRGVAQLAESGMEFDVESFGPTRIIAGEPFNQQPNGSSAMWIRGEFPSVVGLILNGGQRLLSRSSDGKIITLGISERDLGGSVLDLELVDPLDCSHIASFSVPITREKSR